MNRRAKIVCTLGPAVSSYEAVRDLVAAGMDVARLNLSHGSHADHAAFYKWVRQAGDELGRGVGVLADLQGPKIRLGSFAAGPVTWVSGERVIITTDHVPGNHGMVSTTYAGLAADVAGGDRLLVDDGNLALEVERVDGPQVHCRVIEGGIVSDHKGVSLPNVNLSVDALSPKDIEDLHFAVSLRTDMLAVSFVRGPEDIFAVRKMLADAKASDVGVIAKIEMPQAVDRLEEVIAASDGIMVARGDLGVEMALEEVPLVQKRAVRASREAGKPVIVATEMLDSMTIHSRPTRAEVSDVANAVLDGADALMLSAESSVGKHPHTAVATMARVISAAESSLLWQAAPVNTSLETRSAAIARAAADIALQIGACALIAFTQTGGTARRLARHRPVTPLLAFTSEQLVRSQLAVSWGVETFIVPTVASTDEMVRQVDAALRNVGRATPGDSVVIVAGTPPGQTGTTNTIRVHRIGEQI